jgi:hypothetical protein
VGFFAANDFWDARLFDRWLEINPGCNYMVWRDFGRPDHCGDNLSWKTKLWFHRSYLYRLFSGAIIKFRRAWRSKTETFEFADRRHLQLNFDDFRDKTSNSQPDRPGFHLVLEALQELHAATEKDGSKMVIVFQPSKEEVYSSLLNKPISDPSLSLRKELDKSGIDYIDLTPIFRARAVTQKLFFETDGHPNVAGQELIAQGILSYLRGHSTNDNLHDVTVYSPAPEE